MKCYLEIFFPSKADRTIKGSRLPYYLFMVIAMIGLVRSCIHIFSPDGGAGSIARMDLNTNGVSEVIFAFALWGSSQLIYAMIQWIVILRYRSLIPLMWVLQFLETLGRMLVGRIKPITFNHTPPGAYQNYVYLVLSILMVLLAIWTGRKELEKGENVQTPITK